ncbi:hypothetical protein SLS62_000981 [Diatrype stigma]|uniref:ABC transporter domain-containing protein n=1 Tax=Diatrype stigma TaxID=117547 RepID=A0AAN9YX28_9PEZI
MDEKLEPIEDVVRRLLASHTTALSNRSSIVFDKLTVTGSGIGIQAAPNVWTRLKSGLELFNPLSYGRPIPSRTLLHGFSGHLEGGEMLLVIGKPGSGCTTFLKALADMGDEYKSVSGHLTYGGRVANERDQDRARMTFCAEEDSHLPTLTVRETLRFAVTATWDRGSSRDTINTAVETLASCVGLGHVLSTKIGDAAIRGVSGGERKRVSLAEAMATCPDVLCLDNPTNGLDSAIALDYVQMMRHFTNQHGCSTVMSVYQGSEAMIPLFDKVLVINGGRQIYYGKATEAKAYFESLGFVCPERVTTTDFLNSMTAEPELRHVREGWNGPAIRTALQFEEAFRRSEHYKTVAKSLAAAPSRSASEPREVVGPKRRVYSLPLYRQIYECSIRQFKVLALDRNTWMMEALTIIVQSLALGTLYREQPRATGSFVAFSSSLFLAVLVPALQSMAEFNNCFAERPLIIRQKRYRFYRPLAYALGLVVTDAAWKIVAICYNIPQYFLTGFQRSADKFFTWFLIVYILHLALSMIFRAIAVASPSIGRAVLPVGIMFNIFVLYTGLFGMERYKLPAGRLATIFYNLKQKDLVSAATTPDGSDTEKDALKDDEDAPPVQRGVVTAQRTLESMSAHHGRTLTWKGITLKLRHDGEEKCLLNNLNGFVEPGQLTALMGASGAGKTTLLNTLAGRLEFGTLTGDLLLDGGPLPKSFRRYMGYVQQQDVHLPTQTVREALRMTARLRRPVSVPIEEKDAHVEAVIRLLEMEDISEALIGMPGAGLNLEQRKRVTIGVELAARPDILLLDEPTSGLDGQSALVIGHLLQKLAKSGQTVLCTIHQPSAELFELFEHLILLIPGGRLAYDGPLGPKCSTVLEYFARSTQPCGKHENPAEYFVQAVREKAGDGSDYATVWASSAEAAAREAERERRLGELSGAPSPLMLERTHAVPLWQQFLVTMHRVWLYYWRDPDYFVSKLLMNMGNSLVNGLTFLNSGANQGGAYNRVFSAFMALIVGPPIGLQLMPRFVALRDMFLLREKASLTYSWLCFVVPAILIELPYGLVTSLAYWLLWYFPVGYFTESSRAGYSFLMYELFSVFCHSLAQLCAAIMPTLGAAFTTNGFFFMFVNTYSGTLSPEPTTPTGWRWYYKVSPLWYYSEGVMTNALEGLDIVCNTDESSFFQPPANGNATTCGEYADQFLTTATGYLLNPDATADCQYCRFKSGWSYFAQWGYEFVHRYRNVGIFIGFIAFNYTTIIALTYILRVKKWKWKKD